MKRVLVAILGCLVVACAATGPKFQSLQQGAQGSSYVYIMRPKGYVGGMTYPSIYIDEVKVGDLKNGGYLLESLKSGTHKLKEIKKIPEPARIYF